MSEIATVRDVALEAGVSIATVSRVTQGSPRVAEATRARVEAAMRTVGYVPDVTAQTMRTRRSRIVGFLVSDISNPLFAEMAVAAEDVLRAHDHALVVANSNHDPEQERNALRAMQQRRVDHLLVALADDRVSSAGELLGSFRRVVLLDRVVAGARVASVLTDHSPGMEAAVERLATLGHADVTLLVGPPNQAGHRLRAKAFRDAWKRHSQKAGRIRVLRCPPTQQAAAEAMHRLFAQAEPPTAVIAGTNQLTVGALKAARELGIVIPKDLSIIGSDDIDAVQLHSPQIDLIDRDIRRIGAVAAEILMREPEESDRKPPRLSIPTVFRAQGSTAPPRS